MSFYEPAPASGGGYSSPFISTTFAAPAAVQPQQHHAGNGTSRSRTFAAAAASLSSGVAADGLPQSPHVWAMHMSDMLSHSMHRSFDRQGHQHPTDPSYVIR